MDKKIQKPPKNLKHKLFCYEYIAKKFNATEAAISTGYSKRTSYSIGQRLLKNEDVKKYIEYLVEKKTKTLEVTAETVLEELAKCGFSNLVDILSSIGFDFGRLKDLEKLDVNQQASIQEITEIELPNGTIRRKIKLAPKIPALKLLGDHLQIFEEDKDKQIKYLIEIVNADKYKQTKNRK